MRLRIRKRIQKREGKSGSPRRRRIASGRHKMMMRPSRPLTTAALLLGLVAAGAQAQDYPERDVTNVVVWAAGGGSAGMSFVYSQPADGYTLAGISESVVTAGVQGGWDQRMDVWYPFIVGGSPDLISVPADSPHESIEDLVEAAK